MKNLNRIPELFIFGTTPLFILYFYLNGLSNGVDNCDQSNPITCDPSFLAGEILGFFLWPMIFGGLYISLGFYLRSRRLKKEKQHAIQ